MASWNTKYPKRNCAIGAMYWNMPTVDSGNRAAAAANNTNGITVTNPTTGRVTLCTVSNVSKTPIPAAVPSSPIEAKTNHTVDGTANHRVSTVSPVSESTDGPVLFLTRL